MECPNCHKKIGKLDWSQTCKRCGVNLMFYDLEQTMYRDAKQTELSFAKLRVFAAKAKATFVGGAAQIVRLVMIFACIGVMMIPFCTVNVKTVLCEMKIGFQLLDTYNAFTGSGFSSLSALRDSAVAGSVAKDASALYLLILLAAVCGILQLVTLCISLVSPRRLSSLIAVFSALGIGCGVAGVITMIRMYSDADGAVVSVNAGFGAYATIAAFAVMLILNIVLRVRGIDIAYKPGDLYRTEVSRRVKKGELTLDELPLPVFETAEERAERLAEENGNTDEEKNTAPEEETVNG